MMAIGGVSFQFAFNPSSAFCLRCEMVCSLWCTFLNNFNNETDRQTDRPPALGVCKNVFLGSFIPIFISKLSFALICSLIILDFFLHFAIHGKGGEVMHAVVVVDLFILKRVSAYDLTVHDTAFLLKLNRS